MRFRTSPTRRPAGSRCTLWSINDRLASDIADHVYKMLTHDAATGLDTNGTAAALDSAIRAHREKSPWLWASYIHLGP